MAKRGGKGGGRPPEDDLSKKLDEIDSNFNVVEIRKYLKARILSRINKGEVDLVGDLQKLEQLEKGEMPTGLPTPKKEDLPQYGIPEHLLIKRKPYTMTDEAKAQRKTAAKSSKKSDSMKGNKNAYKHGQFAHGFVRQIFRPCLSTCEQYPCAIVQAGKTEPGELCIDKVQFVRTLQAVEDAMKNPKSATFKELASLQIAGSFNVLQNLISDILEYGVLVKSENYNGFGQVIGYDIKANPALPFLAKLMEVMNLSPQDFMITPLIIKKQKTEDKKAKTLADLMSGLGSGKEETEEDEP
jgi:hypothetical protein